MAARRARVEEVLSAAQPWETQQELAEKAGVSLDTIQRVLQKTAPAADCNSPPEPESQTDQVVWFLRKHTPSVKVAADGVFDWYRQLKPGTRRALLKRLQQFEGES